MQLATTVCCLVVAACGDAEVASADRAPASPGAALRLGSVEISAADVEAAAAWFAELEPGGSSTQHRRRAIVEHLLPRAAIRLALPEASASAAEACRRRRAELDGPVLGPEGPDASRTVTGSWRELGIDAWATARAGEPGRWSDPVAGIRHFLLVRPWPEDQEDRGIVRAELELFPIEGAEAVDVDALVREHGLVVLDDAYLSAVPLLYRASTRSAPR